MLITNLNIGRNGRLGNQLFQAATAIGVGERCLGASSLPEAWKLPWACFSYPLPSTSGAIITESIEGLIQGEQGEFVNLTEGRVGYKDIPQYIKTYLTHNPRPTVFNLEGYFQSEKYFNHCRAYILEAFKPNEKIQEYIDKEYSFLKDDIWTSLHVRRGDYVGLSQSHPLNPHPLQEVEYYMKALEELKSQKVLVFSDDLEWCKKTFKGSKFKFVEERIHHKAESDQFNPNFIKLSDENLEGDYTEINIMAACANNIIANSSFSWWGAWFNQNRAKRAIAPLNWFSAQYAAEHTNTPLTYIHDIIPESWTII